MSFVNVVIKQLDITIKQISKVRAEGQNFDVTT